MTTVRFEKTLATRSFLSKTDDGVDEVYVILEISKEDAKEHLEKMDLAKKLKEENDVYAIEFYDGGGLPCGFTATHKLYEDASYPPEGRCWYSEGVLPIDVSGTAEDLGWESDRLRLDGVILHVRHDEMWWTFRPKHWEKTLESSSVSRGLLEEVANG